MYNTLISNGTDIGEKARWKSKIPLKIEVFMWYIRKGVVLTKDNLGRRNWQGDKIHVFCSGNESIQHLFFDCHFAKFIWRAVHISFGVVAPKSIDHMYSAWLHELNSRTKSLFMVVADALWWMIWLSRNDIFFEKCSSKTYMQGALVSVLGAITKAWRGRRSPEERLSNIGDDSHAVLRILSVALLL